MAKIEFNSNSRPTLGIELELGLVDLQTMGLISSYSELVACLPDGKRDAIKPELMQCVLEIITGICETVDDAEAELRDKISLVETATDQLGLGLWWGGTHPFSRWQDQQVTSDPRYYQLVDLLQELARRLVTFGLHVHVGVDSGDKAVMICDRILRHLPTLLALSASSPFWEGRQTGLHSHRSKVMEGLPTAGLPPLMRNWSEYVWLVNHMVGTGFINTIREIWWDVRPHQNFGTVEVRVCDMPGNLEETLAIAALIQCLVKALSDEIDDGTYQHDCHPMMVRQNKWRATRFGTSAQLVDLYTHEVVTVAQVVDDMTRKLQPVSIELGCEQHLLRCRQMASSPGWADRQMTAYKETGNAQEVVRQLTTGARISPFIDNQKSISDNPQPHTSFISKEK